MRQELFGWKEKKNTTGNAGKEGSAPQRYALTHIFNSMYELKHTLLQDITNIATKCAEITFFETSKKSFFGGERKGSRAQGENEGSPHKMKSQRFSITENDNNHNSNNSNNNNNNNNNDNNNNNNNNNNDNNKSEENNDNVSASWIDAELVNIRNEVITATGKVEGGVSKSEFAQWWQTEKTEEEEDEKADNNNNNNNNNNNKQAEREKERRYSEYSYEKEMDEMDEIFYELKSILLCSDFVRMFLLCFQHYIELYFYDVINPTQSQKQQLLVPPAVSNADRKKVAPNDQQQQFPFSKVMTLVLRHFDHLTKLKNTVEHNIDPIKKPKLAFEEWSKIMKRLDSFQPLTDFLAVIGGDFVDPSSPLYIDPNMTQNLSLATIDSPLDPQYSYHQTDSRAIGTLIFSQMITEFLFSFFSLTHSHFSSLHQNTQEKPNLQYHPAFFQIIVSIFLIFFFGMFLRTRPKKKFYFIILILPKKNLQLLRILQQQTLQKSLTCRFSTQFFFRFRSQSVIQVFTEHFPVSNSCEKSN
ncbi:C2H2-type zinc finger-containing protein [Reticulomyxa filosa]|uniref:C2H2-type zinc finger-containing protein n=1 Tax=Reticulomyxa filosa TaxID=46433 RepID=X6NXH5_RETFI|nr:C2H2-type zinc finger-containing protein [Reticulomyxa filosa]|eukprot:ETO31010.1 C2H2-type zinc finger-containing protein [Reticulomyxa filosa]